MEGTMFLGLLLIIYITLALSVCMCCLACTYFKQRLYSYATSTIAGGITNQNRENPEGQPSLDQEELFRNEEIPNLQNLYNQNECAICYTEFDRDIQQNTGSKIGIFNCNHIFCYRCIHDLIRNIHPRKINCPICRREINMIVPAIRNNLTGADRTYVQTIKDYNRMHSGTSSVIFFV